MSVGDCLEDVDVAGVGGFEVAVVVGNVREEGAAAGFEVFRLCVAAALRVMGGRLLSAAVLVEEPAESADV